MTDLEVANTPAAVAKKSTDEQALATALDEKAGAMVDDSGRSIGEDEVEQALTEGKLHVFYWTVYYQQQK